ncbi:MFS transporter [Allostreptomyces psammosilenae]|uniref:MFS family permease n=1 Tax=Allostreptomyces psammosilenae TaxID=1892865 RepID=A0A852ZSF7_9ACTN|nr:MFS transporter [Allostreptomyces psammosilenae]NYI04427.1 MFS family permease [Allostreptomyces psammosilenae]
MRTLLRHRSFRTLVAGAMANRLGDAVAPLALAFAVLDLTGSLTGLGLVVGARSLANVLFLLVGGVLADRLPRGLVLTGSNAAAALTQAAAAVTVLTGTATVPLLAGLAAVNGALAAIAMPASSALLPQTVPPTLLRHANAVQRLGTNSAMILGASVGGALVATTGPGWGLMVDAATFCVATVCFARTRVDAPPRSKEAGADGEAARPGLLRDLREGWTEFVSRTWVWVVVLGFMVLNAVSAGAIQVLGPAVADDSFGRAGWGLVLAAQSAGMLAGALLAMRLRVDRLLFLGTVCVAAELLLPLALATTDSVPVLMAAGFVVGAALTQFGVAWSVSLQQHIPADRLARVYSYDALGSYVAIPVAEVAVGPVAHAVGVRPTLYGAAVVIAVTTGLMLLSGEVRRLRQFSDGHGPDGHRAGGGPVGGEIEQVGGKAEQVGERER